jgi:PAS domain S-box-containing protein/putative nucleotidyltransferase with HDIG domain
LSHLPAKILIVDDTPTGRETLGALLYSEEYELHFASNGQEALEKAAELIPDLILLDVMMPDMNGFEVCEHLRKDEVLAEVPVIMVTALYDRKSRLQGIRAGADDFISKPFDTTELGARVQMIVRLNRYRHLHAERRRFEQIIQFSPDGIVIVDEDGLIQLANQTFLTFLHAEKETQVVGQPLEKFLIGDNPGTYLDVIRQIVSDGGKSVQAETLLAAFDDTSLVIELVMGRFEWDERSMVQVNIHDLTRRNLAEVAKRESERRYRNIFDGAPVAIIEEDFYEVYQELQKLKANGITDMATYLEQHPEFVKRMTNSVMIREVNAYGQLVFHSNQSNERLNKLGVIFFPESYEGFKKILLAIANGDEHCEYENVQKAADGSRLNVLISASLPREAEQFHHVLVSVVDITDLKRAEVALRESERRYRNIFDSAPVAIFEEDWFEVYQAILDLKEQGVQDMQSYLTQHMEFVQQMADTLKIREINANAKKLFNLELGERHSTSLNVIFIPESLQAFKKVLVAIANGDEHCEYKNVQKSVDGKRRNVLVSMSLPQDPEQFRHVLVSVVDITELKQTENALRESEDRYHKMMQMANDAIFVTDAETFQLVDVNENALSLMGMEREDLLSMQIFDLYPDEEKEECSTFYKKMVKKSSRFAESCHIVNVNEKRIDVEITNSRIELGSKTLMMGIFRDITERRKEERVREAILMISIELRKVEKYEDVISVILEKLLLVLNAEGAALSRRDGKMVVLEQASGSWMEKMGNMWKTKENEPRWTEERPYAVHNVWSDRPSIPWMQELPGNIDVLEAPLITHEEVIGDLWVGRVSDWDDADGRILANVADMAANAIQRVNFLAELERRLEYLQALFTLDRAITGSLDLDMIFDVFLQLLDKQLEVGAADVLLYHDGDRLAECVGRIGFRVQASKTIYSWDQLLLANQVVTTGQPVKILDMRAEISKLPEFHSPEILLDKEGIKTYYGVPLKAKGRLLGVLEIFHREVIEYDDTAMDFLLALADQAAIAISQAELFDEMQEANNALIVAYDETIEGWALALEMRDNETQGHSWRVTELVLELAKQMGISGTDLVHLRRGAVLHDIGKMGVPDRILHKPGKLDSDEWEIMKKHPEYGYQMLSNIDFLRDSVNIPLYHHERWDGTGYPEGLKGTEIPLSARIFAIIDVWDAVTNDRPYHAAWSHEEALTHIRAQEGRHFDPDVVRNFLRVLGEGEL